MNRGSTAAVRPQTGPGTMPRDRLPVCDLIIDPDPQTGARNMAVDEALLEAGALADRVVVRIYRWSQPTVSVGYFQQNTMDIPVALKHLPVVRRLSGGGAILHDCELTYSCVLPPVHPARHNPSSLYRVIHHALAECLTELGLPAWIRSERLNVPGDPSAAGGGRREPFLCFLRADGNDIVNADGFKLVGSAQRRRRGVTLQHGSILLSASPLTPGVPGAIDLFPAFDVRQFSDRVPLGIAELFGIRVVCRSLTDEEEERADALSRLQG